MHRLETNSKTILGRYPMLKPRAWTRARFLYTGALRNSISAARDSEGLTLSLVLNKISSPDFRGAFCSCEGEGL
jgi:hypothetical protein